MSAGRRPRHARDSRPRRPGRSRARPPRAPSRSVDRPSPGRRVRSAPGRSWRRPREQRGPAGPGAARVAGPGRRARRSSGNSSVLVESSVVVIDRHLAEPASRIPRSSRPDRRGCGRRARTEDLWTTFPSCLSKRAHIPAGRGGHSLSDVCCPARRGSTCPLDPLPPRPAGHCRRSAGALPLPAAPSSCVARSNAGIGAGVRLARLGQAGRGAGEHGAVAAAGRWRPRGGGGRGAVVARGARWRLRGGGGRAERGGGRGRVRVTRLSGRPRSRSEPVDVLAGPGGVEPDAHRCAGRCHGGIGDDCDAGQPVVHREDARDVGGVTLATVNATSPACRRASGQPATSRTPGSSRSRRTTAIAAPPRGRRAFPAGGRRPHGRRRRARSETERRGRAGGLEPVPATDEDAGIQRRVDVQPAEDDVVDVAGRQVERAGGHERPGVHGYPRAVQRGRRRRVRRAAGRPR